MSLRVVSLSGLLILLSAATAACASGAKADGATVLGRVQDDAGTGLAGAAVVLDGECASS